MEKFQETFPGKSRYLWRHGPTGEWVFGADYTAGVGTLYPTDQLVASTDYSAQAALGRGGRGGAGGPHRDTGDLNEIKI